MMSVDEATEVLINLNRSLLFDEIEDYNSSCGDELKDERLNLKPETFQCIEKE